MTAVNFLFPRGYNEGSLGIKFRRKRDSVMTYLGGSNQKNKSD